MKLENVIKDNLDEAPSSLKGMELASVFMFEHPLNHGKRLGIIRLNNKSLETHAIIELVSQQLTAWQKKDRVIGIWFESDNEKGHLYSETDLWPHQMEMENNEAGKSLSSLVKQIKTYPKACMLWCDQILSLSLSLLFDAVNFSLVGAHSGYQLLDNKPIQGGFKAKLKLCHLNHDQKNCERLSFIEVYPIVCQRSRLLELLSSHPWHNKACREPGQSFGELFDQGTGLLNKQME